MHPPPLCLPFESEVRGHVRLSAPDQNAKRTMSPVAIRRRIECGSMGTAFDLERDGGEGGSVILHCDGRAPAPPSSAPPPTEAMPCRHGFIQQSRSTSRSSLGHQPSPNCVCNIQSSLFVLNTPTSCLCLLSRFVTFARKPKMPHHMKH